ncbi:MAG: class I SAM-dependent methyltransferase [Actinomycetota bacterium]
MSWAWDPSLYRGSARYYLEGRLPYAPGLADALARELGLDGRGRLIDIGCGPGIVALELAALFEEVVGVDADADMIAEAAREAGRRGIENGRWRTMRAEELPGELGPFRVATLAQSFHWMERERVARAIHGMLEPGGALVHVNAFTRRGIEASSSPYPEPPWEAISALVRRYLGSETLAGQGRREAVFVDLDHVLRSFRGPEVVSVPDGRVLVRTIDQVVAAVFSVSSSAPHLFVDRLHRFESDLRRVLTEVSAEGRFSEQTGDTELRIWRLPS